LSAVGTDRGEGILDMNDVRLLMYLADLPRRESPLVFLPSPNPHAHPKSFEIWPASPVGGERPGSGWE